MILHSVMPVSRGSTRKGFTLVELLVSVFIIAIAVALLYPAYKSSKEVSGRAKCMANLRQFAQAVHAHGIETGELVPGREWYTTEDGKALGGGIWRWFLTPYLPRDLKIDTCPVEPEMNSIKLHYGWNWTACGSNRPFRKVASVQYPNRMILMADAPPIDIAWQLLSHDGNAGPITMDSPGRFGFRHGGKAVGLFFDGHMKLLGVADIPQLSERYTAPYLEFWEGK